MIVQRFDNEAQATLWARRWLEQPGLRGEAVNFAISLLIREGYGVKRPSAREEWLTPADLCRRYAPHLTPPALHYRLNRAVAPFFLAKRGKSGRIVAIQPNPVLIDYLSQPCRPGRRSDLAA